MKLLDRRVLLCVGAGGVGKTTTAATLALSAAVQGKKAVVCTIDPARRLASALGMETLDNVERRVPEGHLERSGMSPDTPLFAMMLDMKGAWDGFLERTLPAAQREAIFQNRFYQSLSTKLAGSQEYIAMQKLWELREERDYDLIVLDTPPTIHALDFLDAPKRVLDFFDNEAARWLLTPALLAGKAGLQLFRLTSSFATRTLSKLTGMETLQELAGLLLATEGIHETVRRRAKEIERLLQSREAAFVVVTDLSPSRIRETANFHAILQQRGMTVDAIVVNRIHRPPEPLASSESVDASLSQRLEITWREQESVATADARALEQLRTFCPGAPLLPVPELEEEVYDLSALRQVASHLLV